MKLIFTIFITLFTLIFANKIEELAYKAYEHQDYKRALKLYEKGAKANSLESLFMIGVFLEKGLGIAQDKKKAIKAYKIVLKKARDIIKKEKNLKTLKIAITASKRLYLLTNQKIFLDISYKLKRVKDKSFKEDTSNPNLHIEHYLAQCPAAKIVPSKYQEGIEEIDCELFQKFPDKMANFMYLKYKRDIAINNRDKKELLALNKKIIHIIAPVLKYIEQKTIDCYSNAEFKSDIKACDYEYFSQTDPLLFKTQAYKMEKALANKKEEDKRLDSYEKSKLINSLIYHFSIQDYEKEAYRMVQLY